MDLQALKTELTTDPLTRGYGSMGDEEAANSLNAVNRTREKPTLRGSDIYNALVPGEFTALQAAQQARVRDIFLLGDSIDVRAGTNVRAVLLSVFAAGSQTRANLIAAATEPASRADELGLGFVTPSNVADARRLP